MTFASSDDVHEHLNECISTAVRVVVRNADKDDAIVLRALLNHVNQRFRFSYVLGNGPEVRSGGDCVPNWTRRRKKEDGKLAFDELFEEELDAMLRGDETFHERV